jgi:uncharacterized protein YoxC
MDPCRQEDNIDDIRLTLNRVATALETIAAQGEAIKHLQEDVRDGKSNINTLFARIRAIELQPVKELSKIKIAVGSATISAICSGIGSFLLARFLK